MTKFLFAVLAALVAMGAQARPITFNWTNTTQYRTDGGALATIPANGLRDTVITYGVCTAAGQPGTVNRGTLTAAAPLQTATSPDLPAGAYCATAVHRLNAAAFPAGATLQDSAASNPVTVTIPPPVVQPNPPTFIEAVLAFLRRFFGWFA